MNRANRFLMTTTVLCMALVNAGVLHAVHLHQHCVRHEASGPGGKDHPGGHHDPGKCSLCIHLASGKMISLPIAEPISFTVDPAKERVTFPSLFPPSVFFSSLSTRAPPSFCS